MGDLLGIYMLICTIIVSIVGLVGSVWVICWISEWVLEYATKTFQLHGLFKEFIIQKYSRKSRQ